jgi:hypothetical protein
MPPNDEAKVRELYKHRKHVLAHTKIEYQRKIEECDRIRAALLELIEELDETLCECEEEMEWALLNPSEFPHHIDRCQFRLDQESKTLARVAASSQSGICSYSGGTVTCSQTTCNTTYHSTDWVPLPKS